MYNRLYNNTMYVLRQKKKKKTITISVTIAEDSAGRSTIPGMSWQIYQIRGRHMWPEC